MDSVASFVPEAELAGDIGDQHMGLQSRMLSVRLMRILAGKASRNHLKSPIFHQSNQRKNWSHVWQS